MITQHGPQCDVCGNYILPIGDEQVNFFSIKQIQSSSSLCCHNKCRQQLENLNGDWRQLPSGPLRDAYEEGNAKTKLH